MLSFQSVASTALLKTSFNSLGAIVGIASPTQTGIYSATRSLTNCFVQAAITEGMKMGLAHEAFEGIVANTPQMDVIAETAATILGYLVSARIAIAVTNTVCPSQENSADELDDVFFEVPRDLQEEIASTKDNKIGWTQAFLLDGCGVGAELTLLALN